MTKRVIRLEPGGPQATGMAFLGNCDDEPVTAGNPVETGHEYFVDESGRFSAGLWECTPYTAEYESYPFDEIAFMLSGEVTITDGDGHAETFRAGDCFVIPRGLKCTWHMPETTRKYWVALEHGTE